MKKITLLFVLIIIVSCSTNDDKQEDPVVEVYNYFPLTLSSYWTYNNNNNNGRTDDAVGANGLDNTLENNDTASAVITYTIPNTDLNGNPDF